MTEDTFGCDTCWLADAAATVNALKKVPIETHLVDESHFGVAIRRCTACAQRFIAIFTETVDWADGDDPQGWVVMPITDDEASSLGALEERRVEGEVERLGTGRRSLRNDLPKGGPETATWGRGVFVESHD